MNAAVPPCVAFRVSAAPEVGLGHMVRCLVLSEHFDAPLFVTEAADIEGLIAMGAPRDRVIGLRKGEDIAACVGLRGHDVAAVIVDTLHAGNGAATDAEVAALISAGVHVTVLDSMPPDHYRDPPVGAPVPDLLVTPYLNAANLRPPTAARRWLAGARYAVLPNAYAAARAQPFPEDKRILVACGGADPDGLSARVARLLSDSDTPADIVIGPQFSASLVAELEGLAEAAPALSLHRGVRDLLSLHLASSVVVGRPGLLRYEVAALGRTGIYQWEGEAYLPYFEAFNASGIAEIHLAARPGGRARFEARVRELTRSDTLGQIACRNAAALAAVDGQGAGHIVAALQADLETLRRKGRT